MFTRYKGEILTLFGAIFFSFNGVIAKLVLTSGLSSMRLTQVRCGGAFVFLPNEGFNAATDEYGDLVKAGVIDPV